MKLLKITSNIIIDVDINIKDLIDKYKMSVEVLKNIGREKIYAYTKKINKEPNKYFDHLLGYNYIRKENTMGLQDFVLDHK